MIILLGVLCEVKHLLVMLVFSFCIHKHCLCKLDWLKNTRVSGRAMAEKCQWLQKAIVFAWFDAETMADICFSMISLGVSVQAAVPAK